ncbi:hypothetical protein HAX54_007114 [Datura stramonium]|uniref:Uncharacterized protein n=1 Tax=Datura stramonium TaxID=4076 RepID=A0ABS8TC20_DATST|nr:hypothetical protein [Datura stramonium]
MQKLILDGLQITGDESDESHKVHDQRIVVPTMLNAIGDGFDLLVCYNITAACRGSGRFATSQLPSDLSILVEDITFYVHKYPLVRVWLPKSN